MTEVLVFDIEQAMARVDHDLSLFRELVQIFQDEFTGLSARLTHAADSGDARELEEAAHSLKSSLANIGAMTASTLAAKMEKMGRAGTCAGSVELVRSLKGEVEKFQTEYQRFLASK